MLPEWYIQDFLGLKPELQSFLFRMLTNKQDAEDIVQENIRVLETPKMEISLPSGKWGRSAALCKT